MKMTDAQVVEAAKKIDTPYGPIVLIHTRDDGTEVPTLMARQFAEALADSMPVRIVEVETTPVVIDFESKAGQMVIEITKALHEAGAPMCDEDRRVMSKVEKIQWLGRELAQARQALAATTALADRWKDGPFRAGWESACEEVQARVEARMDAATKEDNDDNEGKPCV
jgi:hypothetical protein